MESTAETERNWTLVRETLAGRPLSVILGHPDGGAVRLALEAHAVPCEVIVTDRVAYPDRGAALRTAFEKTTGEYVFVLESGREESVRLLPRYLAEMTVKCADIVIGSKRHPESAVEYPWYRRFTSWLYFRLVRAFLDVRITDTESGMALFRRETLGYALERMLTKSNAFYLEMLAIAAERGARIFEAPVGTHEVAVAARIDRVAGRIPLALVRAKLLDTLAVFYRLKVLHYYARCLVPRKLAKQPRVSVVIACPRGSWMLDECLAALARQTYGDFEVIVLPDEEEKVEGERSRLTKADEDSAVNLGLGPRPRVRFIPTGKVRPAEKRNLGIREATGEIIAFIDDDAYPDSHWIEYAVKYFGEPSIGAVGGPGVTPPGDAFLAQVGGRVYDNFLLSGNYRYRYHAGGSRMDVEDYPSCNLFVRKDVMVRFGGYRTDFWPGEDTLLCKDILDNWKRIVYDPWVVVYHHRRPLFGAHLRQLGRYGFHRGYFCKRYPSNSLRLSYFVPTGFVVGFLALPWLWPLYALYAALVLATTFSWRPHVWLLTAAGVVASHFWYGVRFACGILARRAPCEYIGKDHA